MSDGDYDGNSDQYEEGGDWQFEGGYVDDLLEGDNEVNTKGAKGTVDSLNIDDLEQKIWLVKVPAFLADKFEQSMNEGTDLGHLKRYNQDVRAEGTSANTQWVLTVPETFKGIPRNYTMGFTQNKVENSYIFEESSNRVGKKVCGTVTKHALVTPFSNDPEYRSILRKRALDAGELNKPILFETQTRQLDYLKPSRGANSSFGGLGKRQKVDLDSKTSRLPYKELRGILFKLFAEYRFWSLKGLQKKTRQPVSHLKDVLKEIAVLNRKGKLHTLYQLKDEYVQGIDHARTEEEDGPMNNPYNNDGNSPLNGDNSDADQGISTGGSSDMDSSDGNDFQEVDG